MSAAAAETLPAVRRRRSRRAAPGHVLLVTSMAIAMMLPVFGLGRALGGSALGYMDSLPNIDHLSPASLLQQDVRIFDRNNRLLADLGSHGDHRVLVALGDIQPMLVNATVAIEDRTFWTNSGVDPQGITRAAVADYQHHGIAQGGSTITQQLVKLLFLNREDRSLQRKSAEALLAVEVAHRYTKAQVMEMYLNTIFYGNQAYGIESASESYFHVHAHELDLAQAALLAGLPSSPSELDPIQYPARAHQRQAAVLEAMAAQGFITPAQALAAGAEELPLFRPENHFEAPHFVDYVLETVARQLKLGPDQLSGLTITTSLDLDKQHLAESVVSDQVSQLAAQNVNDGALVAMDPTNGEILAMVGAADYSGPGGHINMATSPRQPGSSFKIFTYTAAIESRKFNMETPIPDTRLVLPTGGGADGEGVWAPENYDHRFHGTVPLRLALGNSLNIPAVRVELGVSVPKVLDLARRAGVQDLTQPDDYYGPSLTLGAYPIPLVQLATGAGTLANLGVRHLPAPILKVTDSSGRVIYSYDEHNNRAQVIEPAVAFVMAQIMSQDRNRWLEFGIGSDLTLPGRRVAAKTGTTSDFKDNLTVGFTPHLLTAVWVGNPDNSPMINSTGITGAAPIWNHFMTRALGDSPAEWFDQPDGVTQRGDSFFVTGVESSTLQGLLPNEILPSASPSTAATAAPNPPPVVAASPVIQAVPSAQPAPSPPPPSPATEPSPSPPPPPPPSPNPSPQPTHSP